MHPYDNHIIRANALLLVVVLLYACVLYVVVFIFTIMSDGQQIGSPEGFLFILYISTIEILEGKFFRVFPRVSHENK